MRGREEKGERGEDAPAGIVEEERGREPFFGPLPTPSPPLFRSSGYITASIPPATKKTRMRRGDVVFPAPSLPSRRLASGWMADEKEGEEEGGSRRNPLSASLSPPPPPSSK